MYKLPLVVSLVVVASAVAAQSNMLVAVERTPIIGADQRTIAVVFPTACDQQGRAYVRLSRAEVGIVEPILRVLNKGTWKRNSTRQKK